MTIKLGYFPNLTGTGTVPKMLKKKSLVSHTSCSKATQFIFENNTKKITNGHKCFLAAAKDEEPRKPISPRGKAKHHQQQQEGEKSGSKCLKMNNNNITNLECFVDFAKAKFSVWEDIAWIDLSQNEITKLGPVSIIKNFH